jgi:regulator of replication initiation timing
MVGENVMDGLEANIDRLERQLHEADKEMARLEALVDEYVSDQHDARIEIARLEEISDEFEDLERKYKYIVNAIQDAYQSI